MTDIDHWLEQVYQAGGDQATLNRVYDAWAAEYDRHLWSIGNPFIAIAAGLAGRYIPAFDAAILDAGCGTGNLGQVLHQIGYRRIDGLDPSTGMLELANRKEVYEELFQLSLGVEASLPENRYDAVVSTGVLTSGHATPAALDDMLNLVKPGGVIIFSLSELAWENLGFSEKIADFTHRSLWVEQEHSRLFRAHPFSEEEAHVKLWVYVYRKC